MNKYYDTSPKQLEDWEYNRRLNERYPPSVMKINVELPDIDIHAFKSAFEKLIRNHESLRTTFPVIDDQVVQQVEVYTEKFALNCLEGSFSERPDKLFENTVSAMKDLAAGPLIQGFVYQKTNLSFAISIIIHHIISDYWSIQIIKNQLISHYQQAVSGITGKEARPVKQLGEYLTDNGIFFNEDHDQIIYGWLRKLADRQWQVDFAVVHQNLKKKIAKGLPDNPALNWEGLKAADLCTYPEGESYSCCISEMLHNQLVSYKNDFKKSVNMILLVCMNLLGASLTGKRQVLIQSHFMNRNDENEEIIGNFLGKLLLLNTVTAGTASGVLIDQCQASFYQATSQVIFNSSAFDDLDLTTRCFLFYNFISREMSGSGHLRIDPPVYRSNEWVESPLVCQISEHENTLEFKWAYHLKFFDRSTIKSIAEMFEKILFQLVAKRELSIDNIINT